MCVVYVSVCTCVYVWLVLDFRKRHSSEVAIIWVKDVLLFMVESGCISITGDFLFCVLCRYALLTPETYPHWNGRVQDGIKHLMMSVNMEPDQWQLGKTKVFIKSPESVCFVFV